MKWLYIIGQVCGLAVTGYIPSLPLPDGVKHTVMATVSFLQAVLGIIAFYQDPRNGGGQWTPPPAVGAVVVLLAAAVGAIFGFEVVHHLAEYDSVFTLIAGGAHGG